MLLEKSLKSRAASQNQCAYSTNSQSTLFASLIVELAEPLICCLFEVFQRMERPKLMISRQRQVAANLRHSIQADLFLGWA